MLFKRSLLLITGLSTALMIGSVAPPTVLAQEGLATPALGGTGDTAASPVAEGGDGPYVRPYQARRGPLSPQEMEIARRAWKYFATFTQEKTGLVNAVGRYPSTTLWDTASYVSGAVAAYELGIIPKSEFDLRMYKLLGTFRKLKLFRGELPNKVYQTETGEMVDYGNKPGEVGFSALDIGRFLVWMRILKDRYPYLGNSVDGVLLRWNYSNVIDENGTLYGAKVGKKKETVYLQEGRLGYEEYAAKGFMLWGFKPTAARMAKPLATIPICGVDVPYDARDPRVFQTQNYVVTEGYILDGMEMNWDLPGDFSSDDATHTEGWRAEFADRIYKVQECRYETTGMMTARSEHNVQGGPFFVYDTIFSSGYAWNTVSPRGDYSPDYAAVATKAAFGMWALWDTHYTGILYNAISDLFDEERGYYEGLLENGDGPIDVFTSNNNGILLAALLYKAQGKILTPPREPGAEVWFTAMRDGDMRERRNLPEQPDWLKPEAIAAAKVAAPTGAPPTSPAAATAPVAAQSAATPTAAPVGIPPADNPAKIAAQLRALLEAGSAAPMPTPKPLQADQLDWGRLAWRYFEQNTNPDTGLPGSVDSFPGITAWEMGSYFNALVSAERIGLIDRAVFNDRVTKALGSIARLPLYQGALPNKSYDIRTLVMTDYGGNPTDTGIGWSALDIARLLISFKIVEQGYPEHQVAIAQIRNGWKLGQLVSNGVLMGQPIELPQPVQEGRLGYEEYGARGVVMAGLDAQRALEVQDTLRFVEAAGVQVPIDARDQQRFGTYVCTTSEPYIMEGLELGFDDRSRAFAWAVLRAQEARAKAFGIPTALSEGHVPGDPYFVYGCVVGNEVPWAVLSPDSKRFDQLRFLDTKSVFAWSALFPGVYTDSLLQEVFPLNDPTKGWFTGRFETGETNGSITANTNAMILESLHFRAFGPLMTPVGAANP
ncbi:MAG TPA: DUF3131 domain-containing protein [Geminicoccus sp.]|jgi:hypothetical protein|uniref:DUF3131 domain-containing protein n=1 Tax=Geminicoccus sp. TaxID=2024832 RepID=UPI002E31F325|nr:DUF3131 domain-containing protein [Geminicoccus sp.]HEX2526662.1 DUF3131 domain-containing protein [Geminicoccus sp.]